MSIEFKPLPVSEDAFDAATLVRLFLSQGSNNVLYILPCIAHHLSYRPTKHFAKKANIQLRNINVSTLILLNADLDRHEGGDFLIAVFCQDTG